MYKDSTLRTAGAYGVIFWLVFSLGLFSVSCRKESSLERIKASGEITVLTRNNANCYYMYRERPMGFEYDLAKAFADHLGVRIKVRTPAWGDLIEELNRGKGDFIAASMTILPSRKRRVSFSEGYLTVQQRAIVHASNHRINRLEEMEGKTVHVRRNTSYERRLKELRENGREIDLRLHNDIPTEELIGMVSRGEIEVTIADSNIALLNRRYYPNVRIAFPIEESQALGWGVRKEDRELLDSINRFFKHIRDDGTFAKIYESYYANVEIFDYVDLRKYHKRIETRLPEYKSLIQKAAKQYGFDWRLIAAIVYQESHFDPEARSFTGVKGLMQLTRVTAGEMGIEDRLSPEQSIMGGVKYLRRLYEGFDQAEEPDRLLMTLASYNVGRGHILDARKLAREQGLNPNSWSALEEVLPLLRYPKYYEGTVYGYCRGTEPVRYVNRILTYYDILKRKAIL